MPIDGTIFLMSSVDHGTEKENDGTPISPTHHVAHIVARVVGDAYAGPSIRSIAYHRRRSRFSVANSSTDSVPSPREQWYKPHIIGWVVRTLHTFSDDFAHSLNDQNVARWSRRRRWFSWFAPSENHDISPSVSTLKTTRSTAVFTAHYCRVPKHLGGEKKKEMRLRRLSCHRDRIILGRWTADWFKELDLLLDRACSEWVLLWA